jgi:hypothetical protein
MCTVEPNDIASMFGVLPLLEPYAFATNSSLLLPSRSTEENSARRDFADQQDANSTTNEPSTSRNSALPRGGLHASPRSTGAAYPRYTRTRHQPPRFAAPLRSPSVLLAFTGLGIEGGLRVVSRCVRARVGRARERGRLARTDRVLLLDDPGDPRRPRARRAAARPRQPGALRVADVARVPRHRHDLVLFDLVGLARAIACPLPCFRRRRAAMCVHGIELDGPRESARARALRARRSCSRTPDSLPIASRGLSELADRDPRRAAVHRSGAARGMGAAPTRGRAAAREPPR